MKKLSIGSGRHTTICGHSPKRPFDYVGVGTKEIWIKDASGIYRVMYVAKFEEAI